MGFVKLYDSILRSSIWLEDPSTKLVWITMLVLADKDGFVKSSRGGLAHQAGVSRDSCDAALDVLMAPDEDSQTVEFEGRRIEKTDGGWIILNHTKYREMKTERQLKSAERSRKYREAKRNRPVDADDESVTRTHPNASERTVTQTNAPSRSVTPGDAMSASASASASVSEEDQELASSVPTSDKPTPCPGPIKLLPDVAVEQLAAGYGVSERAIRVGIKECSDYWTLGAGAGERRTRASWMKTARTSLKRAHDSGKLAEWDREKTAPSADEVAKTQQEMAKRDRLRDEAAKKKLLADAAASKQANSGSIKDLVEGMIS